MTNNLPKGSVFDLTKYQGKEKVTLSVSDVESFSSIEEYSDILMENGYYFAALKSDIIDETNRFSEDEFVSPEGTIWGWGNAEVKDGKILLSPADYDTDNHIIVESCIIYKGYWKD